MEPLVTLPGKNHNVVQSLSGPIWLNEQGIILVILGKEQEHTLEYAQSQLEAFEKVCGGIPRPVLADFTYVRAMSREAREFYTGEKNMKKISALGIVSGSNMGRFVANFFVGLNLKTEIPIRICEDVNTAKLWLKKFTREY